MSTNYQPNSRRAEVAIVAFALCAWVMLMAIGCSNAAKPAPSAKADDKTKASVTNTNAVVYEITSVFDDDSKKVKDPFFPKSNRRQAKPVMAKGKVAQEASRLADLHLRGVIGSPGRFIAMINDKTFATGEKSQVAVGTGQYLVVKVTKITERSVTVSVDGEAAPRELSLEPTQEAKK